MNYLENLFNLEGKTALITGGGGVLVNYLGYLLYGRLKSLAEIRGLEIGIRRSLE